MDEQDINYISIPRSEWTDDTAWIAIKIIEMKTEKKIPVRNFIRNAIKTPSIIETFNLYF